MRLTSAEIKRFPHPHHNCHCAVPTQFFPDLSRLRKPLPERKRAGHPPVTASSIEEVESILADVTAEKGGGKFVMAHLKDTPGNDARIKQFKATVRNIPLVDEYDDPGKCILTGETVDRRVAIAKAY